MQKNLVILLAAGCGSRFGASVAKQYIDLDGKPLIYYSMATFNANALIDEIVVVTNANAICCVKQLIKDYNFNKVVSVQAGGVNRTQSSICGLNYYAHYSDNCKILFHDVARPLVTDSIINGCVELLDAYQAVTVAYKITDSVLRGQTQTSVVDHFVDRESLYKVQTPQAFYLDKINHAYKTLPPDLDLSDNCQVFQRSFCNELIGIVQGNIMNLKLTYSEDLPVLSAMLAMYKRSSK